MQSRQAMCSQPSGVFFCAVLGVCFGLSVFSVLSGRAVAEELSKSEQADGFVSLFDGKTLGGWVGVKACHSTMPSSTTPS